MTKENYLEILLGGYFDNPNFLADYFVRECKNAELSHISPSEFFDRLLEIINQA